MLLEKYGALSLFLTSLQIYGIPKVGGVSDTAYVLSPIHLNTFDTDHTNIRMTWKLPALDEELKSLKPQLNRSLHFEEVHLHDSLPVYHLTPIHGKYLPPSCH